MTRLLFVLLSLGLTLGAAEMAARHLPLPVPQLDGEISSEGLRWSQFTHHRFEFGGHFVQPAVPVDETPEVHVTLNTLGMRGPEIGEKKSPRVLLLGDSYMAAVRIPFAETFGQRLQKRFGTKSLEFLQMGVPSWAPITEFSWMANQAHHLDVDRVYLFVNDNDFFSADKYNHTDAAYRSYFTFNAEGVPQVMPYLEKHLSLRLKHSALARLSDSTWNKIFVNREIENPKHVATLTPLTSSCLEGKFKPDILEQHMPYAIERFLFMSPLSCWDEALHQTVSVGLESITDFAHYCEKRGIDFVLVFIPLGVEIDAQESVVMNETILGLKPGVSFKQETGLEKTLRQTLAAQKIPFIDLKPGLQAYKRRFGPAKKNFLFLNADGHLSSKGHEATAAILEAHLRQHPLSK